MPDTSPRHPALIGAGGGGSLMDLVRDGIQVTEVAEKFDVHRDTAGRC
jgi:hypothetical protein